MFGEPLTLSFVLGLAISAGGVALVVVPPRRPRSGACERPGFGYEWRVNSGVTVLVPDERGERALADVGGICVVRLAPDALLTDEARTAQVLVAGHTGMQETLARVRELPRLRLVQTLAHGRDQWDGKLPEGVGLSTARGSHGGSTAEWAVAALLAVTREIPAFVASQREHRWDQHRTRTLLGTRALVLGAGDLGVNVRERLVPFGVDVTLVGTRARDGVIDLEQARGMLPQTDALIIVLPLTEATRHLVGADLLAALPDGAVVVNAGRGQLVDPAALLAELRSGRLLAALDVTEPEPLPAGDPLWDAPGLLLTPHVGGATAGSDDRAWAVAAEQIAAFARGERPPNQS